MSELLERVECTRERTITLRRSLHRQPELSFRETATARLIAERCAELGFAVRERVGKTGVLADLDTGTAGPTVLVRADMDALPIEEGDDGRPYRSQVPGVMHACGHDGHVAVGLAVAEILSGMAPRLRGRVRLCFQPAEEIDQGAQRMIAAGALDSVDRAIGLHLQAGVPTGTISIAPGVQWAGSEEVEVMVEGRGGHAGDPEGTIDPIAVGAEIVLASKELVRGRDDVLSIAQFDAGTAPNVTPSSATLRGTLRAFGDRAVLRADLEDLVATVAGAHGAVARVEFGADCPAVVCHPTVVARVRQSLESAALVEHLEEGAPSTASDDMGRFLAEVPGCYFRVGVSDPAAEVVYPHHHPLFDLDERALAIATEALARGTVALLEEEL